jgi:hypothetical protein
MEGTVVAVTKAGFLKIKTGHAPYDAALFYNSPSKRFARGWNTLWWEPLS